MCSSYRLSLVSVPRIGAIVPALILLLGAPGALLRRDAQKAEIP